MDNVGGVCLNRGCIPSKTLISAARRYWDARHGAEFVVEAAMPCARTWRRSWRQEHGGEEAHRRHRPLLKLNGTRWVKGRAELTGPHAARVTQTDGTELEITFEYLILAPAACP
jgi:dihydrolipoamide dehydrogenase